MNARIAFRVCVAALALFCVVGLARVIAIVPLHVPLDPNEGWNAYHAIQATTGGRLYPSADSFLTNNYPPLSFYVVGFFGWLTGDDIVAGRIVSLVSLLITGLAVHICACRLKADSESAAFAALLLVAGLLVFTDYVGMDDPQMLGHAVSLAGLVLLLKEPRETRSVLFAALLMTAAWFVKHNLIALPAAAAIWLAFVDRPKAAWFAGTGLVAGTLGLLLFRIFYGVNLLQVLNSPRIASLNLFAASLGNWLLWANVPLFALAGYLVLRRSDRNIAFCALYALVAMLTGMIFGGGAGVDMNIWFDAMIALALATALLLSRCQSSLRPLAALAYALPLAAGIAVNWDESWLERDFWLHPMQEEAKVADGDIRFLRAHSGPALCEMLSLCYWAGKAAEADVFNLGQAYATGARSDSALRTRLKERRYAVIAFDSLDDFALTPRVKQTLLSAYRVDHANDEGVFLVRANAALRP